jgi:hypothetical protein
LLPKGSLEVGWGNLLASGVSEHVQRRVLPIIAATMRPMWQTIVIADQVTMKLNRLLDRFAPLPVVLSVAVK